MGRQAYLTRLALGRSPFGEPLKDSDGNFILGPHAHDLDNNGYVQQFDDRGHPRNPASKAAARQLRRAQNDVLAAVGVVVRKDEATKSEWEKLTSSEKKQMVRVENQSGRELKTIDRVTGIVASWFINAFRRRTMTFSFYREYPMSFSVWLEYHVLGAQQFFTAGLPAYLLSTLPQMFRYYIRNPDVEEIVNFVNPVGYPEFVSIPWRVLMGCLHSLAFCLEFPLKAFSALQTLQLVKPGTWIPLTTFVPFHRTSPICLPMLPQQLSFAAYFRYLRVCSQTPFFISILHDYLHIHIGYGLYSLIRQVMLRPDRPDSISARISDDVDIIEDTSIPGVGYPRFAADLTRLGRNYGPKSFWGACRRTFPALYQMLNFVTAGKIAKSRGRLTPALNDQLIQHVRNAYRARRRIYGHVLIADSMMDVFLQREITYAAFDGLNLDPDEELVDPFIWTSAALCDVEEESSIPSREPDELFDLTEILHIEDFRQQNDHADSPTRVAPTIEPRTSDGLVQVSGNDRDTDSAIETSTTAQSDANRQRSEPSQDSNSEQIVPVPQPPSQHLGTEVPPDDDQLDTRQAIPVPELGNADARITEQQSAESSGEQPHTPVPGINRARSLTDPWARPVRRPTETRVEFLDTSRTALALLPTVPFSRSEHRMTLLTAFAVDSFAWHASAIITSIILLPIESMYLRSLTNWVLTSDPSQPPGSFASTSPMLTTIAGIMKGTFRVIGMSEWFGGPPTTATSAGRLGYASTVLLSIGLESLLRGSLWYLGARRAMYRGALFGWGKF